MNPSSTSWKTPLNILVADQHIRCLRLHNTCCLHPDVDELNNEVLDDIDLDIEILDCDEDEWVEVVNEGNEYIMVKLRTLVRKIQKSALTRQKLNKLCNIYNEKYLIPILDLQNV